MSRSHRRLTGVLFVSVAVALVSVLPANHAGAATANYVTLGDSYSSGVGTGSYSLSSTCKRSTAAYPYLLAQQRPNTTLDFVACTGATTTDLMNSQITAVNSATTLVTVTIGGNDLGFASLITACITSDCTNALNSTRTSAASTLTPKLDTVYAAIKSRMAAGAKVVVLGYPRLFSSASCLGVTGISTTERSNANLLSDELDRVISLRAGAYGFVYKSTITAFTGHAVCSSSAWINGLNLFNVVESFHPNRTGQSSGYLPLALAAAA